MNYRNEASFTSRLIFQTISSEEIVEIGITSVNYDVYKDEQLSFFNDLDFSEPVTYGYDPFILTNVEFHDNISCRGAIDVQFNVEGIIQNERINFILIIIMPVNPYEIRQTYLINSIWVGCGLGFLLLFLVGLIFRTFQIWKREASYTVEEKEKDRDYFNYIGDKLEEFKKESS